MQIYNLCDKRKQEYLEKSWMIGKLCECMKGLCYAIPFLEEIYAKHVIKTCQKRLYISGSMV
jgi:hypothetical protein